MITTWNNIYNGEYVTLLGSGMGGECKVLARNAGWAVVSVLSGRMKGQHTIHIEDNDPVLLHRARPETATEKKNRTQPKKTPIKSVSMVELEKLFS